MRPLRLPASFALHLAVPLWLASSGCSATPQPEAPSGGASRPGGVVQVAPITVSPYTDAELEKQFEQGRSLLFADRYRDAAEVFDRLVRLAPNGAVAPPSLYNAGLAYEQLGERATAVDRYREQVRRFPELATTRAALLRVTRLLAYLERWPEVVATADQLLPRSDLSVLELVEAHGMRALGLVEQDKLDDAQKAVLTARDLVEKHRLGEAGKPPLELAPVAFALGEVRKKTSEKIVFSPMPASFGDAFEQRAQGLLDAQNAFMDAMRSMDAHWSAMAGYRVGQQYQQLHRDVMRAAVPQGSSTARQKQLFEGAMRLRYRVLLEKGLKMMEATVRLGDRTGEKSDWVGRATEAKRDLELALEAEKAALAKLPFTEAELQAGLDALKGGAAKPAPAKKP
ncbi:MAG: tetratricopeptide repeat protein [Polyangiaceae bacterium]